MSFRNYDRRPSHAYSMLTGETLVLLTGMNAINSDTWIQSLDVNLNLHESVWNAGGQIHAPRVDQAGKSFFWIQVLYPEA